MWSFIMVASTSYVYALRLNMAREGQMPCIWT